jgi:hypothetical protein
MSQKANLKNAFFNLLSNDRHCSKCRYFQKRTKPREKIFVFQTGGAVPPDTYEYCSFNKSEIGNEELNCSNFKRQFGHSLFTEKLIDFNKWAKKQWSLHDKIIALAVTSILTVIGILIYFLR